MGKHGESLASKERQERDKEILRLRLVENWTFERIAEEFGVSKQRIYQIVDDFAPSQYKRE